jgi:hypothetical protein
MKKDLLIDWEKEFDEKVIGNCFAGGTFMNNDSQISYTSGYRDGFEKSKKISKRFLIYAISQTRKETQEQARQEGYEVGYAQGESDSGMPQSMVEFIKSEARKETLEEGEREIINSCKNRNAEDCLVELQIRFNQLKSLKK